jgi:hypothetical protein
LYLITQRKKNFKKIKLNCNSSKLDTSDARGL